MLDKFLRQWHPIYLYIYHVELVPETSIGTYVTLVKMSSEFVGLLSGTNAGRAAGFNPYRTNVENRVSS